MFKGNAHYGTSIELYIFLQVHFFWRRQKIFPQSKPIWHPCWVITTQCRLFRLKEIFHFMAAHMYSLFSPSTITQRYLYKVPLWQWLGLPLNIVLLGISNLLSLSGPIMQYRLRKSRRSCSTCIKGVSENMQPIPIWITLLL